MKLQLLIFVLVATFVAGDDHDDWLGKYGKDCGDFKEKLEEGEGNFCWGDLKAMFQCFLENAQITKDGKFEKGYKHDKIDEGKYNTCIDEAESKGKEAACHFVKCCFHNHCLKSQ